MLSVFRRPSYLAEALPVPLAELDSGDLVLFSGRGFSARLVQGFTGSYWSHVGLVLRLPGHDGPLLWEATRASPLADIHYGTIFDGVQLVSLAEKLAHYPGEVAVRRLLDAGTGRSRYRSMQPLLRQWHARPYCNFVVKKLLAWRSGRDAAHHRHGGFCSELVAEVYKHLQLLPSGKPSIDYMPGDFAPEAPLPLLRGSLSRPLLLRP
jgi:hypothetical protein